MMDQAITRAVGAVPRVVGEFQGYVDGVDGVKPSVRWLDRKNMPQVGDKLYALPPRAAVPRSWSILLTSANHGVVGAAGSEFKAVPEGYERVQVMEIVEAGAAPAPGVDLAGLVRLPLTNEQIDDAWGSIPATFTRGQGEQEWNRENRRDFARAIEREVAAQAGQVAVPEDRQALASEVLAAAQYYADCHYEDGANRGKSGPGFGKKTSRAEGRLMTAVSALAAAPSAPAVAQQAPAQGESFDFHAHLARQAAWSEKTFGPGPRTKGVCDHIRKELLEIEADPLDLREWIDVAILALDGAWRCGGTPEQIIAGIVAKQSKNEGRTWPDWRTADPDKAIEHDRTFDAAPSPAKESK